MEEKHIPASMKVLMVLLWTSVKQKPESNRIPITTFYFPLFLHNASVVPFSLRAQPDVTQNYTITEGTVGHGHCTANIWSGCDI